MYVFNIFTPKIKIIRKHERYITFGIAEVSVSFLSLVQIFRGYISAHLYMQKSKLNI